jgi:hypothetical protein
MGDFCADPMAKDMAREKLNELEHYLCPDIVPLWQSPPVIIVRLE